MLPVLELSAGIDNFSGQYNQQYISNDIFVINNNYSLKDRLVAGNITVINGSVSLKNSRIMTPPDRVKCRVESCNGSINLANIIIKGDVRALNGHIKIKQSTDIIEAAHEGMPLSDMHFIKASNGNIKLLNVRADKVQSHNGRVELRRGSHIKGDVSVDNASDFKSKDTRIEGTLETHGGELVIGEGTYVRRVVLKSGNSDPATAFFSRFHIEDADTPITHQTAWCDGYLFGSLQTEAYPQRVTLQNGSVLRELCFDSLQCILTLQGSARYDGNYDVPGLMVERV